MKMQWIHGLVLGLAACSSPGGSKADAEPQREPGTKARADQEQKDAPDMEMEVVPLQYASAQELEKELKEFLEARRSGPLVLVVADQRTNSLLLKGSREDLAAVRALIAKLDVKQS